MTVSKTGPNLSTEQQTPNDHFQSQLLRLRNNFREELPGRIRRVHELLRSLQESFRTEASAEPEAGTLNHLYQHLHKLTGAAGTFGFWELSQACRRMSHLVEQWLEHASLSPDEGMDQLLAMAETLDPSENPAGDAPLPRAQMPREAIRRIHIVDDDPGQARQLSLWLKEGGYEVEQFHSITVFTDVYETLPTPDMILVDMRFDGERYAGAEHIQKLKQLVGHLPPIVFVSVMEDIHARLKALRVGATRYLVKPVARERLISLADELTGKLPEIPYRVMLVDDDPQVLEVNRLTLEQAGLDVQTLTRPMDTLERIHQFKPDLLVLDLYMPELTGTELAALLREDDSYATMPILFLSTEPDPWQQVSALNMGGDGFLIKPAPPAYLVSMVLARARLARRYAQLANSQPVQAPAPGTYTV